MSREKVLREQDDFLFPCVIAGISIMVLYEPLPMPIIILFTTIYVPMTRTWI